MIDKSKISTKAFSLPAIRLPVESFAGVAYENLVPIVVQTDQKELDTPKQLNIIPVVDKSSSMAKDPSKPKEKSNLEIVQEKLTEILDDIPKDLEKFIRQYILMTFAGDSNTEGAFNNKQSLKEALEEIEISYGTNFQKAFEKLVLFLKAYKKNPDIRNLVLWFTDGDHSPRVSEPEKFKAPTIDDVIQNVNQLSRTGAAMLCIGVNDEYKRDDVDEITKAAKFAGQAHEPVLDGHKSASKAASAQLINGLIKAPYYPVISFSKWFKYVINLCPTAREVNSENIDDHHLQASIKSQEHKPAVVGYQTSSYAVGFIPENMAFNDYIHAIVGDSPNSENQEVEEIAVQPISELRAQPLEKAKIEKVSELAAKQLLLNTGDPLASINSFVAGNNHLPTSSIDDLDALGTMLLETNAENNSKATIPTVADSNSLGMKSLSSSLSVSALDLEDLQTQAVDMVIKDSTVKAANSSTENAGLSKPEVNIERAQFDDGDRVFDLVCEKEGKPSRTIQFRFNNQNRIDTIDMGSSENCNVCIKGDHKVAEKHGKIYLDDHDQIFFANYESNRLHSSFINGTQIDQAVKLNHGDEIKVGDYTFTFLGDGG